MRYMHRFRVKASLAEVAAFHTQAVSMAAITPPPVRVVMHEAPAVLVEGTEMEFSLRLGPLPIRWRARIENLTPTSFDDRLLSGPFQSWTHRRRFACVSNGEVEISEEVTATLKAQLGAWLIGLFMWLNVPILFAYRAWKTRRLLAQRAAPHGVRASTSR